MKPILVLLCLAGCANLSDATLPPPNIIQCAGPIIPPKLKPIPRAVSDLLAYIARIDAAYTQLELARSDCAVKLHRVQTIGDSN